jgi:hypothetical protein
MTISAPLNCIKEYVFSIEVRLNTLPKKQIQLLGVVCNILFGSMELHLYPHNFLMLIRLMYWK